MKVIIAIIVVIVVVALYAFALSACSVARRADEAYERELKNAEREKASQPK